MLLCSLDVVGDLPLGLESVIAALIGAGERTHTIVVHLVTDETLLRGEGFRTAKVGAGELRRIRSVKLLDMRFEVS